MKHYEAIYNSIKEMDIEMLAYFLDEEGDYCRRGKGHLVVHLEEIFINLRQAGNTKLIRKVHSSNAFPEFDMLTGAQVGRIEYQKFQSNKCRHYLALMFYIADDKITRIENAWKFSRKLGSIPVGKMQIILFDDL